MISAPKNKINLITLSRYNLTSRIKLKEFFQFRMSLYTRKKKLKNYFRVLLTIKINMKNNRKILPKNFNLRISKKALKQLWDKL